MIKIPAEKMTKYIIMGQALTFLFLVGLAIVVTLDHLKPLPTSPAINAVVKDMEKASTLDHDHVLMFILKYEGTTTRNEPNGDYSKFGITQTSWKMWRASQGDKTHLPVSVRELKETPVVKRFYYDYLDRFHTWELHSALQLIYADMAVLSGSEAVRIVQEIVGVKVDGMWGSHTQASVKHFNESIKDDAWQAFMNFHTYKLDYLKDLARHPKYAKELKGWLARADDLYNYMERMLNK